MTFAGVNYLAIVVAAVASWIAGAAWYMSLSKPWMAAQDITEADLVGPSGKPPMAPYAIAFVAELVMAWVLAGLLGHLGPVTVRSGVISAAFVWLGFAATTVTVNYAFSRNKPMLTAIDAGHWLLVFVVQGAIIGAFGV